MTPSNLSEAVAAIGTDAGRYGDLLLSHAAAENASTILIGPSGGDATRVAYRIADNDPWFECVPPPSAERRRWIMQLLTRRGIPLDASEALDGAFVEKAASGPSLVWHVRAESFDQAILLTRGDGGVAS
jgi:hypothetical protein